MALSPKELDTIQRLTATIRRDSEDLQRLSNYYEGSQVLEQLGLAVPPELRHLTVMVNWPRVVADSLEERVDLEGFRLSDTEERDDDLWRIWQANNLDEESQLAHLDALIYGRSYICVGANDEDPDTPIVTIESPMEMTAEVSPRTRKVTAALRLYRDHDDEGRILDRATLYLPEVTVWVTRRWSGPTRGWVEDEENPRDEHGLGVVPVVPLVNRSRIQDRAGVSELADVIGLTDAAARALTLAQLATETLSVPQRAVLGASPNDFQDQDGKTLPVWEAYFGAVWALENKDAKVTQFSAADLANFSKILETYATQVASVTGLPLRFFGQNTANPPSEGAIIADETRLIKKAERRHRAWGGSWEDAARLIKRIQTGEWDEDLKSLETIWRNPATPTQAQTADAAVKLVAAGILPIEAAWEEMGYSQTKIKKLKAMREDQLRATDVLARQLATYRGLTSPDEGAVDDSAPPADRAADVQAA